MKKISQYLFALVAVVATAACVPQKQVSAEQKQAAKTKQLQAEADRQIGMPDIINFQERKFAKQILEMRDKAISTYTYIIDMNGRKHFICESVGYGLPYSVQFTNPEKIQRVYQGAYLAMPQADPNGLYMPDGLSATWVLCSDGKKGVKPVYIESEILVSPFKMH